jgi:PIN domain nuclease of toxin-antitoxin system
VIVLDTHAWLWWRDENPLLSSVARQAIEDAPRVGVPTACCLELATLERRGRLRLDRDVRSWIRAALDVVAIESVPLTDEIAVAAGRLPESFPGDPVDRIVYATAVALRTKLVTRDRRITYHDPTRVVW